MSKKKSYDVIKEEFGDKIVVKTVPTISEADKFTEELILNRTKMEEKTVAYYIRPYFND